MNEDPVGFSYGGALPRAVWDVLALAYINKDHSEEMDQIMFAYDELVETGAIGDQKYAKLFNEKFEQVIKNEKV
jgi:hypothetical protein